MLKGNGNVGLNKSDPAVQLDVNGDTYVRGSLALIGNTRTISPGDSGAGYMKIFGGGTHQGGGIEFRGGGNSGDLRFFTGTSGAGTERMRINSSGNIAIGSGITPSFKLSTVTGSTVTYSSRSDYSDKGILGNLHPSIKCHDISTMSVNDVRNLGFGARYDNDASGTKPTSYGVIRVFEHYTGQTGKGSTHISQLAVAHSNNPAWYARNSDVTNGTSYGNWYLIDMTSTSDERSKENVTDASNQLDVINQFKVKEFDYIDNDDEPRQLGMMAQHVDTFAPEYVTKDDEDPEILWRIKYNKMVPMLIKSIQELSAKVTALENAS